MKLVVHFSRKNSQVTHKQLELCHYFFDLNGFILYGSAPAFNIWFRLMRRKSSYCAWSFTSANIYLDHINYNGAVVVESKASAIHLHLHSYNEFNK